MNGGAIGLRNVYALDSVSGVFDLPRDLTGGGFVGKRRVPGIDGYPGVWSLREIGDAMRAGAWIDPHWANVKALLQFEGVDGSTTITDATGLHAWTARGNAQIDTDVKIFGKSTLLLDGTGDWVDTPNHADFRLGGLDYTIDMLVQVAVAKVATLSNKRDSSSAEEHSWYANDDGSMSMNLYSGGSSIGTVTAPAGSLSVGATHHIETSRSGTTMKMFVDGVLAGTTTGVTGSASTNTSGLRVGRDGFNTGRDFNGRIKSYRFTLGVQRHASDFIPPIPLFPER